jgi:dolichyl-phosphate beta-glucosyltransferase
MPRRRFALVIPAYNERLRLPATLVAIAAADTGGFELAGIHLADNGSTDGTAEVASELAARLGLNLTVHQVSVHGKARALAAVMPEAANEVDAVLFMDADNATDLSEITRFDPSDESSIQIASRYVAGSVIEAEGGRRPWSRALMGAALRVLTRVLLRLPYRDTQCGFKLFPADTVEPLFGTMRSRSWVFDAELLARARRSRLEVRETPVHWVEMPGSKVRPVQDSLGSLIGLLEIRWWLWRER